MTPDIYVALIGAAAVILAAWITARVKRRGKQTGESGSVEIVGRDKIAGDAIGRDKVESHKHFYVEENKERKSWLGYWLEKLFVFVFTVAVTGVMFGGIGFFVGEGVGMTIGIGFAVIAGIVNAASVKRTKGFG